MVGLVIAFSYTSNKTIETISRDVIEDASEPIYTAQSQIIENVDDNRGETSAITTEPSNDAIKKAWTDEDLELLACVIYCEAGADYVSNDTRLKVGCVVMNRVEHDLYPDTLYEVLMQRGQYGRFYWTGVVWPKRATSNVETHAVQRAYEIAERVLNGERVLDKSYVYQSEHKQTNDYIFQDGMYFCRLNK